jgi:predicted transcriptional regulator
VNKNLPDKVDELLTEVVNKDPLTLASISAVPYFGGVLATFFSAKWLEIYQERTKALFEQLAEHLNNVDEQAVRRDYFDTPEGMDLLIRAVEESSKTRSDNKRDLIARILRGAVLDYERGEYSPEEYLNLISDLTERELMVASSLYKTRPAWASSIRMWASKTSRELELDTSDLEMILARLEARGLIQKSEMAALDVSGYPPENYKYAPKKSTIFISPMFRKLMDFLELRG